MLGIRDGDQTAILIGYYNNINTCFTYNIQNSKIIIIQYLVSVL